MNSSLRAIWAAQGSKEKKVDLSFSEHLLRARKKIWVVQNPKMLSSVSSIDANNNFVVLVYFSLIP